MNEPNIDQLNAFYELSSALTGFEVIDLLGTGVGQEYFDQLVKGAGQEHVDALLAAAEQAGNSETELRNIFDSDRFGPLAKNIIFMWLLGSWYPLPELWHTAHRPDQDAVPQQVVSAITYQEALWSRIIGAHPRGAKPPGFGSWGDKATLGGHDAEWSSPQ